jgi:hypothetical protein
MFLYFNIPHYCGKAHEDSDGEVVKIREKVDVPNHEISTRAMPENCLESKTTQKAQGNFKFLHSVHFNESVRIRQIFVRHGNSSDKPFIVIQKSIKKSFNNFDLFHKVLR